MLVQIRGFLEIILFNMFTPEHILIGIASGSQCKYYQGNFGAKVTKIMNYYLSLEQI